MKAERGQTREGGENVSDGCGINERQTRNRRRAIKGGSIVERTETFYRLAHSDVGD